METTVTRFTLTIPIDIANHAEMLKKNFFYDKPYAEMYRQIIQLGMKEFEKTKAKNNHDSVS